MSCLFRSLAVFVRGMDEDALRHVICDYLEKNPMIMDDLSLRDVLIGEGVGAEDYVRSMRHRAAWGGAIEVKAFCEIYQVGVIVRIQQTGKEILFRPSSAARATRINAVVIEWQGAHYEPVLS